MSHCSFHVHNQLVNLGLVVNLRESVWLRQQPDAPLPMFVEGCETGEGAPDHRMAEISAIALFELIGFRFKDEKANQTSICKGRGGRRPVGQGWKAPI